MTHDETLERAAEILRAMYRADVPTVARLAQALYDLAEQEHLDEVADASVDIERVAGEKVVTLTGPFNRLSAALNAVERRRAA